MFIMMMSSVIYSYCNALMYCRHLVEGDFDDKSHKGHPRCEFCKDHYLDKDELYRHLKMEHFSCFICGTASTVNRVLPYYATYDDLRQHFKK